MITEITYGTKSKAVKAANELRNAGKVVKIFKKVINMMVTDIGRKQLVPMRDVVYFLKVS